MLDAIRARLEGSLGRERVQRLHRSGVAVIGAGLLGGQLVAHLAMLQIRTLLVDPGLVDPENLGNQALPSVSLGDPKVRVRAEQMRSLNPSCPVRAIQARVEELGLGSFAGVDLLLTGLDGPAARLAVNRIAGRLGLDWIDAAVDGTGQRSYGTVTWLRPAQDDIACYGCRWDAGALAALGRERRRQPCASWRRAEQPATPPTLTASPFGAVVAGFQLSWALQALLGESQEQVGQQLQISASGTPRLRNVGLARRGDCAFPHRRLESLRRVACRRVGELVELARGDLGAEPEALVLERPLVFGLACTACGTRRELVKRCEAVGDDEVRCGCGAEMAPLEIGTRLAGERLRALDARTFGSLGIPAQDLVSAAVGERRVHYLLPADPCLLPADAGEEATWQRT